MQISIYSTKNCAFCKTEKQWLDSKGIVYDEIDIEEDMEAANYLDELTQAQSVPVTLVVKDGKTEVIRGFNRPALMSAIGIK